MAKVINLRAVRKSAARDAARKQGDANAAKFGRSKAGRQANATEIQRNERHLDNHRLDGSTDD